MAAKKTAPAAKSTAMVPWEEQMAQYADKAVAVTGTSGGSFISLKGGVITIDGTPVPNNKMEAVVVGHIFENAWRPGEYDANNPQPPECYALGDDQDTMAPHPDSANPQGFAWNADTGALDGNARDKDGNILGRCADCWANEWGSADKGRGKACKNQRRLAIIAGDEESLKDVAAEKLEFIRTPVTSSSVWDDHVKLVATTLRRPPFAVVTEISLAPDPKTQFRMVFKVARTIDSQDQFEALREKHTAAMDKLPFPYPAPSEAPPPPPKTNAKFAGRGKPAAPSRPAAKGAARR